MTCRGKSPGKRYSSVCAGATDSTRFRQKGQCSLLAPGAGECLEPRSVKPAWTKQPVPSQPLKGVGDEGIKHPFTKRHVLGTCCAPHHILNPWVANMACGQWACIHSCGTPIYAKLNKYLKIEVRKGRRGWIKQF